MYNIGSWSTVNHAVECQPLSCDVDVNVPSVACHFDVSSALVSCDERQIWVPTTNSAVRLRPCHMF
jgi:hypothetical protein